MAKRQARATEAFNGRAVKEARVALGLSITRCAADVGLSARTLEGYEAGWRRPSLDTLCRLAAYLGCTPGDFLAPAALNDRAAS